MMFNLFKSKERIQQELVASCGPEFYINFYGNLAPKGSLWFYRYHSAQELTEDQRIFMSYYTEESFQSILGEWYAINGKKVYLSEVMKAVEHFINTGEKKYFYEHGQLNGIANYGQYVVRGGK